MSLGGPSWFATLLVISPLLASCAMIPFVAPNRKTVLPEFDKLPGKRVAVLVWTDPSTLFDYPYARLELATYVGDKLFAETSRLKLEVDVVDPRDLADYLQRNRTARIDPREVGRHFQADYVVFLEILTFQMRDPDHPQFLRGRIGSAVSVHDMRAEVDELQRYELSPVQSVYPEGAPVILTATNAPFVREATYRLFAELVARKFYEHSIES